MRYQDVLDRALEMYAASGRRHWNAEDQSTRNYFMAVAEEMLRAEEILEKKKTQGYDTLQEKKMDLE